MRKVLFVMFWLLLSLMYVFSQEPAENTLDFKGAINNNRGTQAEYFEQRRTVLQGLNLTDRSMVQVGISKTRIENEEYLEFPLIFRYQAYENISVYGGVQGKLSRDAQQGSIPGFKALQTTFGVDYDITPLWDAGIQFVIPLSKETNIPDISPQPIRLRTGIKF